MATLVRLAGGGSGVRARPQHVLVSPVVADHQQPQPARWLEEPGLPLGCSRKCL